ncbi:hypothetical protein PROFUN_06398 [Planoprotostelium fungivorum]|uniref:Uncharacterized protein n=1 Tax=Planoprotostelium fungivorum TaxID=1890364 RepID=A0A2P6NNS3_9EUKA|nr:hypothetical protein PROFUN_06398 [Planoprotostelium fungivorum]
MNRYQIIAIVLFLRICVLFVASSPKLDNSKLICGTTACNPQTERCCAVHNFSPLCYNTLEHRCTVNHEGQVILCDRTDERCSYARCFNPRTGHVNTTCKMEELKMH